ncbi:hypothetical protein D3C86_2072810 [compost metagenome]
MGLQRKILHIGLAELVVRPLIPEAGARILSFGRYSPGFPVQEPSAVQIKRKLAHRSGNRRRNRPPP